MGERPSKRYSKLPRSSVPAFLQDEPAAQQDEEAGLTAAGSAGDNDVDDDDSGEELPLLHRDAPGPSMGGVGPDGLPYGNLNYPASSTHGEKASLTCVIPPFPFWQLCGLYRVGRIWVFHGAGLHADVDASAARADDEAPTIKCSVGPCWLMLILTYVLVVGISGALFSMTFPRVPLYLRALALLLLLCSVVSLSSTACGDPGVVRRLESADVDEHPELQKMVYWSHNAQCYYRHVPGKSVAWDSETQTLVYNYDHFCPWMGTAVAGGNIRSFYLFLASVVGLLIMVEIGRAHV